METWETLTMSAKEVRRPGLLKDARAGHVSNAQGAAALHLSIRQFQRLKRQGRAGSRSTSASQATMQAASSACRSSK